MKGGAAALMEEVACLVTSELVYSLRRWVQYEDKGDDDNDVDYVLGIKIFRFGTF